MDVSSLELCCASDSELAAAVVEHSVVIRVTSSEDLQLTSTRPAMDRLLRILQIMRRGCGYLGFDPMHSWHAFQAD